MLLRNAVTAAIYVQVHISLKPKDQHRHLHRVTTSYATQLLHILTAVLIYYILCNTV
jgi:hypothetical protein